MRHDPGVKTWRVIDSGDLSGARNMALDEALLRVMEERLARGEEVAPILRLYAWAPPAVSTGRHQALEEACDVEACREAGVDVVRRPTGGRGVLHEDEVTFAVVAPGVGPFEGPGVTRASASIATGLLLGLSRLGVEASVERGVVDARAARREACFAAASRAEIVAGGRKLCGSAQFRGRHAVLQHGSLPMTFDAQRQARLLGASADILRSRATGLAQCMGRRPDVVEVHDALVAGFAEGFECDMAHAALDELESRAWREAAARIEADPQAFLSAGAHAEARA
jgi:lipoate-protein ligase A